MANQIFREKNLEKVASPEQLNDYLRVTNPGVWIILISVIIFLIGLGVWTVASTLDTSLNVLVKVGGGTATTFIKQEDRDKVHEGLSLNVDGQNLVISGLNATPVSAGNTLNEYERHLGKINPDDWVFIASAPTNLSDGTYSGRIVVDSVSPISFIFN